MSMPDDPVVFLSAYRTEPERLRVLVRRVAFRDKRAFARLYDALSPTITRAVCDVVADPIRAKAITAAAFLEVWRSAPRYTSSDPDVIEWIADIALDNAEMPPTADDLRNRLGDDRSLAKLLQRP